MKSTGRASSGFCPWGKVIAHKNFLGKLMKKVEKVNKKPPVFLVPRKSEGPYV
jgi:hypothetical protein